MMITYYLPRMSDQPRWKPWVQYRPVNRIFKKAIEDYYIDHYLEWCSLSVDCELHAGKEEYSFHSFDDEPGNRTALLSSDRYRRLVTSNYYRQIDHALSDFCERGYHPYMIMRLDGGAMDMVPMDLQLRSTILDRFCVFDWRTYFCTLFYELRAE
jgi:hypothetical protein